MVLSTRHTIAFAAFLFCIINCMPVFAQEICDNGIDDDGNGLADLFDPTCQCRYNVAGNMLANGSFENYNHCPLNYTYGETLDIVPPWQYGANTNEGEFYHNLSCPYDSAVVMLKMAPNLPLPHGESFVSIYNATFVTPRPEAEIPKTYVGQCLQVPLKKGGDYTLSFDAGRFISWDNLTGDIFPFTVAVFGNADCDAVPFGKQYSFGTGCPVNYSGWVLLGKITVTTSGQWVQSKIHLSIPFDINTIQVGPDCSILPEIHNLADSTTFLDYHLYYLDNLHLLPTKDFPFQYIRAAATLNCDDLPVLQAADFPNAAYQWYKDSLALPGETSGTLSIKDTSGVHFYNARITSISTCVITEPFLVTGSRLNDVNIPADAILCAGDSLLLSPAINGIAYTINGIPASEVKISAAGAYKVVASDINGCQKVFETNISAGNCTDCEAYIPNAFTPNGDGLNDFFKMKVGCLSTSFNCKVYDRWGQLVFQSADIGQGWNGKKGDQPMPAATYVYFISYKLSSGLLKRHTGSVTLIR